MEIGGVQQVQAARYSANVIELPVHQRRNLYLIGLEDGRRAGRAEADAQLGVIGFVLGAALVALLAFLMLT